MSNDVFSGVSAASAAEALPSIGGAAVRAALESTTQASVLLQLYTGVLGATPPIVLPQRIDTLTGSTVSVDIGTHQTTGKTNATHFLQTINPLLASTSASVVGFGNLWNSTFSALMGYAANITNPTSRTAFDSGLLLLKNQVVIQQNGLASLLDQLGGFQKLVLVDHDNLAADSALVEKAFNSIEGEIATLKAKIDDENGRRGQYIGIIVTGVIGVIGGVVMILVGSLVTIATDGLAVGLVLGGIVLTSGGLAAIGTAAGDLSDLDKQITKDSTTLAQDQAIFTAVEQGRQNVASLVGAIETGLKALGALQASWQALAADLDRIQQDLSVANPDASGWLTSILTKANDEWNDALAIAKSLQRFGNLPLQTRRMEDAA